MNRKKGLFVVLGILIVVISIWTIGTGFRKETTAYVYDYSLNEDASAMTLCAGVSSSIGYIRKAKTSQTPDGEIKIDFISAFGGLNGRIGARSSYEINLDENISSISVCQGDHYRLILKKDPDSGKWIPIDWLPASAQP